MRRLSRNDVRSAARSIAAFGWAPWARILICSPESQIDSDDTQKPAAIPTIVLERYVDFTNQRLIPRDAGEQTVFDVGLKLVGDDDVFARQRDAHILVQANGAPKTLRRELVLLHLPPKGDRADVKSFGSPFPVALVTLESSSNEVTFLRLEIESVSDRTASLPLGDLRRQFAYGDARSVCEDDGALDGVLELSDVSGPLVVDQRRHRLSRHRLDVLLDANCRLAERIRGRVPGCRLDAPAMPAP